MRTVRRGLSLLLVALALLEFTTEYAIAGGRSGSGGNVSVRGYYRKDGTYVSPHVRSAPDGNPYNNYGFPGNYNPNTGKISPGNPDTYLENYNRKHTGSPSGGGSISVPHLNDPAPAAGERSLLGSSSAPRFDSPPVSTRNLTVAPAVSAGPSSLDSAPVRTWRGPQSLDR